MAAAGADIFVSSCEIIWNLGPAVNKLEEICATKREEVAARKRERSLDYLDELARAQTPPRGFRAALERAQRDGFGLIAEI